MAEPLPRRIVVLGVGNLVMGDEGLGVRCVQELESRKLLPPSVGLLDGGTSTHELLADLENLDLLVIVDAVATGGAPASLVRMEGSAIDSAFSNTLSPHQHGICDLLATLTLLGRAPAKVVLHGMTPKRIELGLELSPEVAAALPALQARVVREVEEGG